MSNSGQPQLVIPARRDKRLTGPASLRLVSLLMAIAILSLAGRAWGQAAWEYSPYEVRVCVATTPQPEFSPQFEARLRGVLTGRAENVFFTTWRLNAAGAPPSVAGIMLSSWDQLTFDDLKLASPDLLTGDKLYLLSIVKDEGDFLIRARELDLRTRQFGPTLERRSGQLDFVPFAAWDALAECFTPLARIERVDEKKVAARVRAGGLIVESASAALIQPGDVLRPVIRRNDRSGEPLKTGGIQAMQWTVVTVKDRTDSLLDCEVTSGYRSPIPSRGGVRMERLIVLARPRLPATRLVLRARGKDPHPLSGYEIYVKGIDGNPSQLMGVTDWRGSIEVPRGDVPVRTLYVRNGNQLIARLPIVPGDIEEEVATTLEDDFRLLTEGFVMALQGRVTDLVARREILAVRIRQRIKEGKLNEAADMLEQYRVLESRDDLLRDLDAHQGRISQSEGTIDQLTRARIDKLMGEARKMLLNRFLDPDTKNVLAKELEGAKTGKTAAVSGP